jgi:hypothetical protein
MAIKNANQSSVSITLLLVAALQTFFLNVKTYEIEHYCKTLHKLTPQIKYLASRHLNALQQANHAPLYLSKKPITHLFNHPSLSGSSSNIPSM